MKFYRVAVADVDSDGSGLTDWEKFQLGLSLTNAYSNGQEDGNGNALGDYAYVTNMLAFAECNHDRGDGSDGDAA